MENLKEKSQLCTNCDKILGPGQKFCVNCGTPRKKEENKVCPRCSVEIQDGQKFCTNCGQNIASNRCETQRPISNEAFTHANQSKPKKSKKTFIIGGIVVAVIGILIVMISINAGPNFKKVYEEYCDPTWSSYGTDGSFLSIDTNPDDEYDNGIAYYEAYDAIQFVNGALGLPEYLFTDMGETTANDGRQTQVHGKITVIWKYHPDSGLEVTYRK